MNYICVSIGGGSINMNRIYPITIGKEYTDFSIKSVSNPHKNWQVHDEIKQDSIDKGDEQILIMNDRDKLQWTPIKLFKTREDLREEKLNKLFKKWKEKK